MTNTAMNRLLVSDHDLARLLMNTGNTLQSSGERKDALVQYGMAEVLLQGLVNDPVNPRPDLKLELAKLLVNTGVALGSLGEWSAALVKYRQAEQLLRALVGDPVNPRPELAPDLASLLMNIGNALASSGEVNNGLLLYGIDERLLRARTTIDEPLHLRQRLTETVTLDYLGYPGGREPFTQQWCKKDEWLARKLEQPTKTLLTDARRFANAELATESTVEAATPLPFLRAAPDQDHALADCDFLIGPVDPHALPQDLTTIDGWGLLEQVDGAWEVLPAQIDDYVSDDNSGGMVVLGVSIMGLAPQHYPLAQWVPTNIAAYRLDPTSKQITSVVFVLRIKSSKNDPTMSLRDLY